jgi:hypothetical protein
MNPWFGVQGPPAPGVIETEMGAQWLEEKWKKIITSIPLGRRCSSFIVHR